LVINSAKSIALESLKIKNVEKEIDGFHLENIYQDKRK
jgi:hypothetical protein